MQYPRSPPEVSAESPRSIRGVGFEDFEDDVGPQHGWTADLAGREAASVGVFDVPEAAFVASSMMRPRITGRSS